jgi:hypothetical protein
MSISDHCLEALGILQEEAAEVIKEISKIRRTGPDYCPFGGDTSNWQNAQNEIYDFLILAELAGFSLTLPDVYRARKVESLRKWSGLRLED